MGVNFPDVRDIINWGPARTILDQHQQAGRAGRDGLTSHVIVLYHGQQAGPCEQAVKEFVRSHECLRVAAYKTLDADIQPIEPLHDCCSNCKIECKCNGKTCDVDFLPFEKEYVQIDLSTRSDNHPCKTVSYKDRIDLRNALMEVLHGVQSEAISLDDTSRHGFSIQLVEDITANCDTIFGINDIMANFAVYSLTNAQKILEVIQKIFLDIPNFDETMTLIGSENHPDTESHFNWWDFEENLTFNDESESE